MIVMTANKKKVLDVVSVYVEGRKDRENLNRMYDYLVRGVLADGRKEVISRHSTEEEAIDTLKRIADYHKAVMA